MHGGLRGGSRPRRAGFLLAALIGASMVTLASPAARAAGTAPSASAGKALDPAARMQAGDAASEYWTLFVDLDSGHRITQRFLITNAGPGDHSAVAVGHLLEKGRAPYRYVNGRRRGAWTLSPDKLFLDIAASHLDLHRPKGALRITKEDVEIRLDFDFEAGGLAGRVPAAQLPSGYSVDVLAVGAPTRGTLKAPWMTAPLPVQGRTWLVHTWMKPEEASLIGRRIDVFGASGATRLYALEVRHGDHFAGSWQLLARAGKASSAASSGSGGESVAAAGWKADSKLLSGKAGVGYPVPARFDLSAAGRSGEIRLTRIGLQFDPLDVIPQPFRWFIRRSSHPQEVWADTRIAVSIGRALGSSTVPPSSGEKQVSNSKRESEAQTPETSVTGVASITFTNPVDRR